MNIHERIKILRKDYLNITQEEFSNSVKISRANLGSIEVGRINVTDRVMQDICREFNVNEQWLRTGKGEIFDELSEDEETMALIGQICSDDNKFKKAALQLAANMIQDDNCWNVIQEQMKKLIESESNKEG